MKLPYVKKATWEHRAFSKKDAIIKIDDDE